MLSAPFTIVLIRVKSSYCLLDAYSAGHVQFSSLQPPYMFSFVLMAHISKVFKESALGFKPGLFVPQSPSTGSLSVDHSGGHSRPPRLSSGEPAEQMPVCDPTCSIAVQVQPDQNEPRGQAKGRGYPKVTEA